MTGDEDLYFNPESNKTPIIIQTHRGKTDVKLWLFCYNDRVGVVKKYKKKVVAYSLRSDSHQEQIVNDVLQCPELDGANCPKTDGYTVQK